MELRSEHACTIADQSTEAINTMTTREKIRFDITAFFTTTEYQ